MASRSCCFLVVGPSDVVRLLAKVLHRRGTDGLTNRRQIPADPGAAADRVDSELDALSGGVHPHRVDSDEFGLRRPRLDLVKLEQLRHRTRAQFHYLDLVGTHQQP